MNQSIIMDQIIIMNFWTDVVDLIGRMSLVWCIWSVMFYGYQRFIEPSIAIPSFKKEFQRTINTLGFTFYIFITYWANVSFEHALDYGVLCLLSITFGLGFFYLSRFLEKRF